MLGSVKGRSESPARLWSRKNQDPGSSYLGTKKGQVRELPRDERAQPGAGGHPACLLADT